MMGQSIIKSAQWVLDHPVGCIIVGCNSMDFEPGVRSYCRVHNQRLQHNISGQLPKVSMLTGKPLDNSK